MKKREECKNDPSMTSVCQVVLKISHPKVPVGWTSQFCGFSASFPRKYDVTDAIRQDNEKNESALSRQPFLQFV